MMVDFIPLPGGVKLCFNFKLQDVPVTFCVHAWVNTPVTQGKTDAVAAVGKAWWETYGKDAFSQDLSITSIVATDVSQQPAYQSTEDSFTATTGTIAVEALPNGSAIVVTLKSAYIGRSYRGRVFLPGIDINAVTQNTLSSGAKSNIGSTIAELRNMLISSGFQMIIASYQNNLAHRSTAVGTVVTDIQVRENVKSQRRRNLPG